MRKGAVISLAALVLAAISCTDSCESGTGNPVPSCVQKKIIHASDNAGRGRLIVRFGDEALACLEQNIPTRSGEPLARPGIGTVDSVLDELGYAPWKGFSLWSPSLSRRRTRPDCTAGTLSISVITLIWMRLRSVCRHWGRSRRARSLSRAALWGIARRGYCNLHASSPNFLATPICALRRSMQRSWMKTSARQLILSRPYNQN